MLERSREINAYQQAQVARNGRVRQKKKKKPYRRNETAATAPGCAYSPPAAPPAISLDLPFCTYRVASRPAKLPRCLKGTTVQVGN